MSIKKIACCTDFSENAEAAFETALEMAEKYQARLSVIHVLPPVVNPLTDTELMMLTDESRPSLILKLEERMEQTYGGKIPDHIDHRFVVLDGHISTEILTYLEENNTDIVVTGSYGLTGMGLVLFGSVAKRVSQKAPCSVMIVRRQEEVQEASL
ncbi:universal stress protein [Desulfonema magnum]|uniref:Universal stress protein, UspA-like n=1 Tax=Desulfonema magnum TaxID=45655 RepID=A0A975BI05_9BACT|nr:universal stress protein [Desulfonema magnum]QTA85584.1 Universal stress protein, UspA-like [Desulfonema magnum]